MKYLNALNCISGIGTKKIQKLLTYFEKPENVWQADIEQLKASGLGEKTAERLYGEIASLNPEEEWEKLVRENIQIITINSPHYPVLLKEIPDFPYILYAKGQLDILGAHTFFVSLVGSRKHSPYGKQIAISFAHDLAQAGITVVSGLALGIDTFAHQGALEAQGKTIAVLGNSLDEKSIYPRNNFSLAQEIINNGLLLSEYPPVTPAGPLTFPARNRIVAGLSRGTLVIEAGEKSGALITASMALEYNREVFSIPGSIFSEESRGTNTLLKRGAKCVTNIKDILEELEISPIKEKTVIKKNPDSEEERILLKFLSTDPIHIDNLVKITKLKTSAVSSTLAIMELKGWVKNIGGQNYIIL